MPDIELLEYRLDVKNGNLISYHKVDGRNANLFNMLMGLRLVCPQCVRIFYCRTLYISTAMCRTLLSLGRFRRKAGVGVGQPLEIFARIKAEVDVLTRGDFWKILEVRRD